MDNKKFSEMLRKAATESQPSPTGSSGGTGDTSKFRQMLEAATTERKPFPTVVNPISASGKDTEKKRNKPNQLTDRERQQQKSRGLAMEKLLRDTANNPDAKLNVGADFYISRYENAQKALGASKEKIDAYGSAVDAKPSGNGMEDIRRYYFGEDREEERAKIRDWLTGKGYDGFVNQMRQYDDLYRGRDTATRNFRNAEDFERVSAARNAEQYNGDAILDYVYALNSGSEHGESPVNDLLALSKRYDAGTLPELHGGAWGTDDPYAYILSNDTRADLRHLSADEEQMYYYILNKQGAGAARDYLDSIASLTNMRAQQAQAEKVSRMNGWEAALYSAASVPARALGSIWSIADKIDQLGQGKIGYSRNQALTNLSDTIRAETAGRLDEATGGVNLFGFGAGDVYQALMSGADSAFGAGVFGHGYTALMGLGAASAEAEKLTRAGASEGQIIAGALTAGAAETVFEYASIEHLIKMRDPQTISQAVKNALVQGGIEASEEVFTEISNMFTNWLIMGSQSDIINGINERMARGESKLMASVGYFMSSVYEAGMGGFISGGAAGGSTVAGAVLDNAGQTRQVGNAIRSTEGGVDALKVLAQQVAEKKGNRQERGIARQVERTEKKTTDRNVGKLSNKIDRYRATQNRGDIAKALQEKGGLSGIRAISAAQTVSDVLDGNADELTQERFAKLMENEKVAAAVNELWSPTSSVAVRNRSHTLTRMGESAEGVAEINNAIEAITKDTGEEADVQKAMEKAQEGYETSGDGETFLKETGLKADGIKIVGRENGKLMVEVQTEEGTQTVPASEISYASEEQAKIFGTLDLGGIDAESAQAIAQGYTSGMNVDNYLMGTDLAYRNGKYNLREGMEQVAELIGTEAAENAWQRGRITALEAARAQNTTTGKKTGGVSYEGDRSDYSNLSDVQNASVKVLDKLGKALGINYHLYKSYVKDGKRVYEHNGEVVTAPNGYFKTESGEIYIDINAGDNGEGVILWTAAHEMVHDMRRNNAEGFNKLADFLFTAIEKDGVSVHDLALEKMVRDENLTEEAAMEEVVADAMQEMLTSEDAAEQVRKLKTEDKGLWRKLRDVFKDLAKKLHALYQQFAPQTHEAQIVRQMEQAVQDRLAELFYEGVATAAENRNAETKTAEAEKNTTKEGGVKMSARSDQQRDADYMAAVKAGDIETAQRMVDEAARDAGYTEKVYHGTPNGTFTKFKEWQYFTKNKSYADVYQNQGASSNGYKKTADLPRTYSLYLDPRRIFDTRKSTDRRIFMDEFYRKWGNGAPLSENTGLPDWTDGDDLIEFFDENGYDYDAFLVDEGGTGGYGDDVKSRGISYVVKSPEQLKSADPVTYDDNGNVIPISERFNPEKKDIRYSTRNRNVDSDGRQLTEEQQKFFEGSKVRDSKGRLLTVYHGTTEDFHQFDIGKAGKNGRKEGFGFYFTDNREITGMYGGRQIEAYLDIKKPLYNDRVTLTKGEVKKFAVAITDAVAEEYGESWKDGFLSNYVDTYSGVSKSAAALEFVNMIWDSSESDQDLIYEIANGSGMNYGTDSIEKFYAVLKSSIGVDGNISKLENNGQSSMIYVAFFPEQIKYVDNKTPTSNPDMRLSQRGGAVTTRDMLTLMDAETVKNADEKRRLTEYQEKAAAYDEQQYIIATLTEDLREIRRGKGKRNMDIVRDLQAEIRKAENRANLYAGQMARLENGTFIQRILNRDLREKAGIAAAKEAELTRTAEQLRRENQKLQTELYSSKVEALAESALREQEYNERLLEARRSAEESRRKQAQGYNEKLRDAKKENAALERTADRLRQQNQRLESELYAAEVEAKAKSALREQEFNDQLRATREDYQERSRKKAAEVNERIRKLREEFRARRAKELQERREKYENSLREMREGFKERSKQRTAEFNERLRKVREGYQESRKRDVEKRGNTVIRHKIAKLENDLRNQLLKPSEGHYVPKELVSSTIDLLNAINMDSGRSEKVKEKISMIRTEYDAMRNEPKYAMFHENVFSDALQRLAENVGDTSVAKMDRQQLETVYEVLKAMHATIRDAVRLTIGTEEYNAYQLSKQATNETMAVKTQDSLASHWIGKQLRAETAFERFGGFAKDSAWSKLAKLLNDGQLKQTKITMEASQIFAALVNDKQGKNLLDTGDKATVDIGLKDENGEAVKITRGMMLSIYMHLQNDQNARHLALGGFTLPGIKAYYKGDMGKAWGSGHGSIPGVSAELTKLEHQIENETDEGKRAVLEQRYEELAEDLLPAAEEYTNRLSAAIEKQLTEYDRKWISAAKEFFDGYSRRVLNEATDQMYHFSKANVQNYFPIRTDPNYRQASFESITRDMSLENSGFMKERVAGARNPILLEDITDAINGQVRRVAAYAGLAPAIRNFQKVYGKVMKNYENSLQNALATKFGENGKEYVENLLADLTGSRRSKGTIFDSLRGNMAGATLSLNPRVALAQAASFPTAAAELGVAPLAKALAKGGKNGWMFSAADRELIAKYSPLLWYRMQGYRDTEIGDLKASQQFMAQANKKLRWALGWIQAMDGATVGRLWYAAQYYVDDHHSDLEKGSDAYYQKVAEVFNRVVEKTQPNYTVMQRPDILRNPNALWKQLTMFMTQRLQNFNIVYEGLGRWKKYSSDYKNGRNGVTRADLAEARNTALRSVGSQVAAAATIAAFKLLADALTHSMGAYRDDDEELTGSSIVLELVNIFTDSIISSTLWGSEFSRAVKYTIALFKGESASFDMISISGIENLVSTLQSVIDSASGVGKLFDPDQRGSELKAMEKAALAISQAFGIPLKNAKKLVKGAIDTATEAANGEAWQSQGVKRTRAQNKNLLYKFMAAGQTEEAAKIAATFDTDKKLHDAIREALREHDDRITYAAYAFAMGNIERYLDTVGEIENENHFVHDDIIGAIGSMKGILESAAEAYAISDNKKYRDAVNNIAKSCSLDHNEVEEMVQKIATTVEPVEEKTEASKPAPGTAEDIVDAVIGGQDEAAKQLIRLIVKYKVDDGKKSEKDADKDLKSSLGTEIKNRIKAGTLAEKQAAAMLVSYCGYDKASATKKAKYWSFIASTGYEWSEEQYEKYLDIKNVSTEMYDRYLSGIKGLRKQDEIVAVIQKLPISARQKDELYLSKYTDANLSKTPWH